MPRQGTGMSLVVVVIFHVCRSLHRRIFGHGLESTVQLVIEVYVGCNLKKNLLQRRLELRRITSQPPRK